MRTLAPRAWTVGWLASLALLAIVATTPVPTPVAMSTWTRLSIPECPHRWDSVVYDTSISHASSVQNVPEFHDCQRFIVPARGRAGEQPPVRPTTADQRSELTYDELYAIFSSWDLRGRADNARTHPIIRAQVAAPTIDSIKSAGDTILASATRTSPQMTGAGWAWAEIYAEGRYPPLGIDSGFSCVYFYFTGLDGRTIQAKVVNYGTVNQPNCRTPVNPLTLSGLVLEVRPTRDPSFNSPDDYPNVARWDWDSVHTTQYFGLGCVDHTGAPAWCEVGPKGFVSSGLPRIAPPASTSPSYPPHWERVFRIKGWFDEQQLDKPRTSPPTLSQVRGFVFPEPSLDPDVRSKDKFKDWTPVARIALQPPRIGYETKLNIWPTGNDATGIPWNGVAWDKLNRLELCWGSWFHCTFPHRWDLMASNPCNVDLAHVKPEDRKRWWARTISPTGETQYYCATRRDHNDVLPHADATARWRFRNDDPGVWEDCAYGCCETP